MRPTLDLDRACRCIGVVAVFCNVGGVSTVSSEPAMSAVPHQRSAYRHFQPVTTRWQDNDIHGHINNVAYYGFFDTTVNGWLIAHGGLDIHEGQAIALVVSSACDYFASLAYPEVVEVGLRVARLGGSTVEFELAVFRVGEQEPCAAGRVVQVFVDRHSGQPLTLSERLREALQALLAA